MQIIMHSAFFIYNKCNYNFTHIQTIKLKGLNKTRHVHVYMLYTMNIIQAPPLPSLHYSMHNPPTTVDRDIFAGKIFRL